MASGDGSVDIFCRIPMELNYLVRAYQRDRRLISLRDAIVELLETHPGIASQIDKVYNVASTNNPPPS